MKITSKQTSLLSPVPSPLSPIYMCIIAYIEMND